MNLKLTSDEHVIQLNSFVHLYHYQYIIVFEFTSLYIIMMNRNITAQDERHMPMVRHEQPPVFHDDSKRHVTNVSVYE